MNISDSNQDLASRLCRIEQMNQQHHARLLATKECQECDLTKADLHEKNLHKAQLRRVNLSGANLSKTNLTEADLGYANLKDADLGDALLCGANLAFAYLNDTNLSNANLSFATLSNTNFSGANLSNAKLINTIWDDDTNLERANIGGADFRKVLNLTPEKVKTAKNWEKACYDPDFHKQLGLPETSEN